MDPFLDLPGGSDSEEENSDRITLNVGGIKFESYVSTLHNIPDTRLAWMTENLDSEAITSKEFFFDRHPGVFVHILNFYRTGKLHTPTDVCGPLFEEELQFWGIDEKQMEPCCWETFTKHREAEENLKSFEGPGFEDLQIKSNRKMSSISFSGYSWMQNKFDETWKMMDSPHSSNFARRFSIFSCLMIIISVSLYCIGTMEELDCCKDYIRVVNLFCAVFFTIEFLTRVIVSPDRIRFWKQTMNWIDFLSLFPTYLLEIFPSSVWISNLVIIRLLRLFRFFKLSYGLQVLVHTLKASFYELTLLLLIVLIPLVVFSSMVYAVEHSQHETKFKSIPDTFWWCLITMTTVGYGDMYPMSWAGKMIGGVCAVCGLLIVALPISVIGSNFSLYYAHVRARLKLPKKNRTLLQGNLRGLLKQPLSLSSRDRDRKSINRRNNHAIKRRTTQQNPRNRSNGQPLTLQLKRKPGQLTQDCKPAEPQYDQQLPVSPDCKDSMVSSVMGSMEITAESMQQSTNHIRTNGRRRRKAAFLSQENTSIESIPTSPYSTSGLRRGGFDRESSTSNGHQEGPATTTSQPFQEDPPSSSPTGHGYLPMQVPALTRSRSSSVESTNAVIHGLNGREAGAMIVELGIQSDVELANEVCNTDDSRDEQAIRLNASCSGIVSVYCAKSNEQNLGNSSQRQSRDDLCILPNSSSNTSSINGIHPSSQYTLSKNTTKCSKQQKFSPGNLPGMMSAMSNKSIDQSNNCNKQPKDSKDSNNSYKHSVTSTGSFRNSYKNLSLKSPFKHFCGKKTSKAAVEQPVLTRKRSRRGALANHYQSSDSESDETEDILHVPVLNNSSSMCSLDRNGLSPAAAYYQTSNYQRRQTTALPLHGSSGKQSDRNLLLPQPKVYAKSTMVLSSSANQHEPTRNSAKEQPIPDKNRMPYRKGIPKFVAVIDKGSIVSIDKLNVDPFNDVLMGQQLTCDLRHSELLLAISDRGLSNSTSLIDLGGGGEIGSNFTVDKQIQDQIMLSIEEIQLSESTCQGAKNRQSDKEPLLPGIFREQTMAESRLSNGHVPSSFGDNDELLCSDKPSSYNQLTNTSDPKQLANVCDYKQLTNGVNGRPSEASTTQCNNGEVNNTQQSNHGAFAENAEGSSSTNGSLQLHGHLHHSADADLVLLAAPDDPDSTHSCEISQEGFENNNRCIISPSRETEETSKAKFDSKKSLQNNIVLNQLYSANNCPTVAQEQRNGISFP